MIPMVSLLRNFRSTWSIRNDSGLKRRSCIGHPSLVKRWLSCESRHAKVEDRLPSLGSAIFSRRHQSISRNLASWIHKTSGPPLFEHETLWGVPSLKTFIGPLKFGLGTRPIATRSPSCFVSEKCCFRKIWGANHARLQYSLNYGVNMWARQFLQTWWRYCCGISIALSGETLNKNFWKN